MELNIAKKILDDISEMVGFSIEETPDSNQINLYTHGINKELLLSYNALFNHDNSPVFDFLLLSQIDLSFKMIKNVINYKKLFDSEKWDTIENIKNTSILLSNIKKGFVQKIELEKLDGSQILCAWDDAMSRVLKPYYLDRIANFDTQSPSLQKAYYIVKDTNLFLNYIQSYSINHKDLLHIFPCFFETTNAQLGYFVFAFVKNGEVKLLTDKGDSGNPETYKRSRRPEKKAEQRAERAYLPYDEIEEIISKNTLPINDIGFSMIESELLQPETNNYMYFLYYLLINRLDSYENIPVISTGESAIKLIGEAKPSTAKFDSYKPEHDIIFNEIMSAHFEENTLPQLVDNDKMLSKFGNELNTIENHSLIREWHHYNDISTSVNNQLIDKYGTREFIGSYRNMTSGIKQFSKLIYDTKRDCILSKIDSKKIISKIQFSHSFTDFGFAEKEKDFVSSVLFEVVNERTGFFHFCNFESIDFEKGIKESRCAFSGRRKTAYFKIQIRYFKEILWLLDLGRNEIPPFARAYRAHNLIPYTGNSILNMTNPLTGVKDPCSDYYANGMFIYIPINLVWWKKYSEKLNDEKTIEFKTV